MRWYVLPLANPDGLDRWFDRPRAAGGANAPPVDDDADGLVDEDPPDDLDGDGLITWMLVEDPDGRWALTDDGLPVKADPARGRPGLYRRELEGHDQDGDGRYNEDGPGGVDVARNFPHAFEAWGDAGRWPGDQPESRAILEFAFDHPDIALVLTLGDRNNLWSPPEPQADVAADKPVAPGWRLARQLGLEADAEYPLELVLARGPRARRAPASPPAAVRARLHLEPVTKPLADDLAWWGALATAYHAFQRDHGLDAPREAPRRAPAAGSAAAWAYFQFGVPAVALDLWSLPAPVDTAEVDSTLADAVRGPAPDPVLARLKQRTEHDQPRRLAPLVAGDPARRHRAPWSAAPNPAPCTPPRPTPPRFAPGPTSRSAWTSPPGCRAWPSTRSWSRRAAARCTPSPPWCATAAACPTPRPWAR